MAGKHWSDAGEQAFGIPIDAGVSVLVGADYDKILSYSSEILSKSREETRLKAVNPYGKGDSAIIIEGLISQYFEL